MSAILAPAPRLLRLGAIGERLALSKSAIYARLDRNSPYFDPAFPRPIKLGNGKRPPVAWVESEVDAYIAARIEASRQVA